MPEAAVARDQLARRLAVRLTALALIAWTAVLTVPLLDFKADPAVESRQNDVPPSLLPRAVSTLFMLASAFLFWRMTAGWLGAGAGGLALLLYATHPWYACAAAEATPHAGMALSGIAAMYLYELGRERNPFAACFAGVLLALLACLDFWIAVASFAAWCATDAHLALRTRGVPWRLLVAGGVFAGLGLLLLAGVNDFTVRPLTGNRGVALAHMTSLGWHIAPWIAVFAALGLARRAWKASDARMLLAAHWALAWCLVAWPRLLSADESGSDVGMLLIAGSLALGALVQGRLPLWAAVFAALMIAWTVGGGGTLWIFDPPSLFWPLWGFVVLAVCLCGVLLVMPATWRHSLPLAFVLLGAASLPGVYMKLEAVNPLRLELVRFYFFRDGTREPKGAAARLYIIHNAPANWLSRALNGRMASDPASWMRRVDHEEQLLRLLDEAAFSHVEIHDYSSISRSFWLHAVPHTDAGSRLGYPWNIRAFRVQDLRVVRTGAETGRDLPFFRVVQLAAFPGDTAALLRLYSHGRVERVAWRERLDVPLEPFWMAPLHPPYAPFVDIECVGDAVYALDARGQLFHTGPGPALAGLQPPRPCVDMAFVRGGRGYYILEENGTVHAFGEAVDFGVAGRVNRIPWRIKAAPDGSGYVIFHRTRGLSVAGDIPLDADKREFGWEGDVGRDLELCPQTGAPVVLDYAGGLHALGAQVRYETPYWNPGAKDAVDLAILSDGRVLVVSKTGSVWSLP